ncbi:MAG: ABC-2 family transporter protein [Planctomycetes bacterium]|nr:ABC-2 family transporter protein [Planctomycetota bacterium]
MLRHLRLIWLFTRVSIQDTAAYRTDFFAHVLVTIFNGGAELVGLWTIFSNTRSLNGWNAFQMVALLGVFRTMNGIIGMVIAPNMRLIMDDIREGKLDFIILKPINAQFYASFRRVIVWRLADIALGLGLVAVACVKLSASLTADKLLMFLVMLSAGSVIIYSFWLVLATLAFWLTRVNNMEMVFWNVFEAGRYPVDIYRPTVRLGLTYVVPLAFITTFPAAALVGKAQASGVALAVLFAAAALAAGSSFWRYGLRHYSGASA